MGIMEDDCLSDGGSSNPLGIITKLGLATGCNKPSHPPSRRRGQWPPYQTVYFAEILSTEYEALPNFIRFLFLVP
jgi:hypothetical protein